MWIWMYRSNADKIFYTCQILEKNGTERYSTTATHARKESL
jgi:hypothetical protein